MLPEKSMDLAFVDETVVPKFLSPRDAVWVRGLMVELDGFVGHTGRDLDDEERRLIRRCREAGASYPAATGVLKVLSGFWTRKVVSAARPPEIRKALFDMAATERLRSQALEAAAKELGITPQQVMDGLFADLPANRRIIGPEEPPYPQQVIEFYNLQLVQGLLARSENITVLVKENVRSVVRFAKLKGLLCTYSQDESGTMIELSGPLSLFRHTTKYGNSLAQFFPSVVVTPGWSLGATCLLRPPPWLLDEDQTLRPGRYRFLLDCSAPVHTTHKLPSDADSAVERKLLKDVKRLRSGWEIERETTALPVGRSVFFPDYRLVKGNTRLLVEVIGYYTPEYLQAKLEKLRLARVSNMLVCIDEHLACNDEDITADVVLRYSRRIDAKALLDAAERLVAR